MLLVFGVSHMSARLLYFICALFVFLVSVEWVWYIRGGQDLGIETILEPDSCQSPYFYFTFLVSLLASLPYSHPQYSPLHPCCWVLRGLVHLKAVKVSSFGSLIQSTSRLTCSWVKVIQQQIPQGQRGFCQECCKNSILFSQFPFKTPDLWFIAHFICSYCSNHSICLPFFCISKTSTEQEMKQKSTITCPTTGTLNKWQICTSKFSHWGQIPVFQSGTL